MQSIEAIILRAIPVNTKCAYDEAYNKERRRWLKEQFELYLSEYAESVLATNTHGLGEGTNRLQPVREM